MHGCVRVGREGVEEPRPKLDAKRQQLGRSSRVHSFFHGAFGARPILPVPDTAKKSSWITIYPPFIAEQRVGEGIEGVDAWRQLVKPSSIWIGFEAEITGNIWHLE